MHITALCKKLIGLSFTKENQHNFCKIQCPVWILNPSLILQFTWKTAWWEISLQCVECPDPLSCRKHTLCTRTHTLTHSQAHAHTLLCCHPKVWPERQQVADYLPPPLHCKMNVRWHQSLRPSKLVFHLCFIMKESPKRKWVCSPKHTLSVHELRR